MTDIKRIQEIAIGSYFELETQLILCEKLGFIENEKLKEIMLSISKLQKQINSLIGKLKE